jgi:UDP:flavonoid glycosyltransferase YjiC (YdhE family)
MNIVLVTSGSRGDVQPILSLGQGLQKAGHRVRLAAPPENAPWAAFAGLDFAPFSGNFEKLIDGIPAAHTVSAALTFTRFIYRDIQRQFAQLPDILKGADLVLAASLSIATPSVAQWLQIPYGFIAFCPQLLASDAHPAPAVPFQNLPPIINRLCWRLDGGLDGLTYRRLINRYRTRLSLPPIRSTIGHLFAGGVIVASDKGLSPVPADVTVSHTQSGYLHPPPPYTADKALARFLDGGSTPVYCGFGSMPPTDLQRLVPLVVRAALAAKKRMIISIRGLDGHRSTQHTYFLKGAVSHHWLFPQVAAVIHHGGAGTTATAAWAGIPQVLVPHILDQFYWAQRIRQLQLGPRGIWRARLTASKLTRAIERACREPVYKKKARQVADTIQPRHSLHRTMELITDGFFTPS